MEASGSPRGGVPKMKRKVGRPASSFPTNLEFANEPSAIILDLGNYSIRVGFAGEDKPLLEIPSIAGTWVEQDSNEPKVKTTFGVVGVNAVREHKEVKKIINRSMCDFDLMEPLLEELFKKHLNITPSCTPILVTEPIWHVPSRREKMMEFLFEKYSIPNFYVAKDAQLSAVAYGTQTGLVVDSGEDHTTVVAVYNCHVLLRTCITSSFGGQYIREECSKFLQSNYINVIPYYMVKSKTPVQPFTQSNWKAKDLPPISKSWHDYMYWDTVEDFKRSMLEVDTTDAGSVYLDKRYDFPDGFNCVFGRERKSILENYFNPLIPPSNNCHSITTQIASCIKLCPVDIVPMLYRNIVVVGGNTMFEGFKERLQTELQKQVAFKVNIQTRTPTQQRYSSFIGGSIMASAAAFNQMWISQNEYLQAGDIVISRKCE